MEYASCEEKKQHKPTSWKQTAVWKQATDDITNNYKKENVPKAWNKSLKYQLYIPYKEIKIQQCLFSCSESYPYIVTR
jgi:hypothetical protein